ncbi:aromatic amino acid lyase [Micromonospora inyonensis]|uniref:aromatic amino acid lyase n=1 Tax=Micromonospora inyonensis TaxID=47866 RepID=UPI00159F0DF6|nr:aromatic amino acid lyase [Micromonospora inyonensis]
MNRSMPSADLVLDGRSLTIEEVVSVARPAEQVALRLSDGAADAMKSSLDLKHELLAQRIPIYGVTTGFGDSCVRQIAPEKAWDLQRNLVLYHLNGVGPTAAPRSPGPRC